MNPVFLSNKKEIFYQKLFSERTLPFTPKKPKFPTVSIKNLSLHPQTSCNPDNNASFQFTETNNKELFELHAEA